MKIVLVVFAVVAMFFFSPASVRADGGETSKAPESLWAGSFFGTAIPTSSRFGSRQEDVTLVVNEEGGRCRVKYALGNSPDEVEGEISEGGRKLSFPKGNAAWVLEVNGNEVRGTHYSAGHKGSMQITLNRVLQKSQK